MRRAYAEREVARLQEQLQEVLKPAMEIMDRLDAEVAS
jgi:hypothetical protein